MRGAFRYLGRNPSLTVGIALLAALGLFFLPVGLDEIANPRLRRSA